ncbi:predicted protein [Cyanophage PSS2]|uniref:fiber protein n=1 Tax=Cyanophage PSS2 TaxID=658401 RepID=UPI0001B0401E|nr:fiber protein [Cyanophage PSS2]ACT65634.1 fiber protein [Cyanophage PSS2]ACY75776.1 predicted protein [Cyanophage PSS2]
MPYGKLKVDSIETSAEELTLPTNAGSAGQVLTTDGSGVLSFTTNPAGCDLSATATGSGLTVESSNGDNVALPAASVSAWGLMTDEDKAKLDSIDNGASADQTGAEIKTAYEAEADTNAFTDAEKTKLSGIPAGANEYVISADLLDEDDFASDSATKPASQQSIKAYVDGEVSNLVNSAPATLDTLDELAAALGDDQNFATTMTNNLASKAPLNEPNFTGNVDMDTHLNVAGAIDAGGPVNVGAALDTGSGVNIYGGGSVYIRQTGTGTSDKLLILQNNNSAEVASLNGGGGATFATDVTVTSGHFMASSDSSSAKTFISGSSGSENAVIRASGKAEFTGVTVSGQAVGAVVALTDAATVAVDLSLSNNFSLTTTAGVGDTRTLGTPTSALPGQSGVIWIHQDATGSRQLAYAAEWKFAGGTAPVLSTDADAVDCLAYSVLANDKILATAILKVS